jgi:hypothetical protein
MVAESIYAPETGPAPTTPEQVGEALVMYEAAELKAAKEDDATKAISAWVKDRFARAKNDRQMVERQWLKNIDMVEGRQFTKFDPSSGQNKMRPIPARRGQPQIALNIIEPRIRTEIAKTGASHPSATVAPASDDDDDIQAAQAAQAVWEWFDQSTDFHVKVFNQANYWRAVCGVGFAKIYYDHDKVDTAATELAKKRFLAEMAAAAEAPAMGLPPQPPAPVRGKIVGQHVNPFNLYVADHSITDLQEQPYIFHTYPMPVGEAKMRYAAYVEDPDWNPGHVEVDESTRANLRRTTSAGKQNPDTTMVMETWIRPGVEPRFPRGGVVITIGDEIVAMSKEKFPYDFEKYPFAVLTGIENGRFYRRSLVESLIPLQADFNKTAGLIMQTKNQMANQGFFYDSGSLDPRKITNQIGQWIGTDVSFRRPEAIPTKEIPQYVIQWMQQLSTLTDDISGQHQVSRAIAPGADTAASAIQILQEKDDDFLASTLASIDHAFKDAATFVIGLAIQFWDEPRLVKIAGAERSFAVHQLTGADIASGTDIRVDPQTGLPTSKAGRIAVLTEWADKQYITPSQFLLAVGTGALGKVESMINADLAQAERENVEMQKLDPAEIVAAQEQELAELQGQIAEQQGAGPEGAPAPEEGGNPFGGIVDPAVGLEEGAEAPQGAEPASAEEVPGETAEGATAAAGMAMAPPTGPAAFPINEFDNHMVHAETHARFMKGQTYKGLDPAVQEVFLEHWRAHTQAGAMQQAAMAAQQMGPSVPGEDSAPPA